MIEARDAFMEADTRSGGEREGGKVQGLSAA